MIDQVQQWLASQQQNQVSRVGLILAVTLLLVLAARLFLVPFLKRLARKSTTDADDQILDLVWPAIFRSIVLQGALVAILDLLEEPTAERITAGIVYTVLVLIWGRVLAGVGGVIFVKMSSNAEHHDWIQPATVPLYQFLYKVLIFGMMSYLLMSAWHVNLTSWLASAGVAGIALGFAAKDTLANFISGVVILGDAPYRVGEYIVIDGETRGMVTDIGMRSTRLLTRDNVEVTVPNAVIGNAKIINESSGPSVHMRLRIDVGVAYGSDVDQVRQILMDCALQAAYVSVDQEPSVRFTAMGDSSLNFQVLVWVVHPQFRGQLIDDLNTRIYKALNEAGVQIPFPQRDLHIKSWPGPPERS